MIRVLLVFSLSCLFTMTTISTCSHKSVIKQDEMVPFVVTDRNDKKYAADIRLIIDGEKMCSGVVIDDHYALSAAHCSEEFLDRFFGNIEIRDFEDRDTNITAYFVAINKDKDVGLLRGDFHDFNTRVPLTNNIADSNATLKACGFPSNGAYYCATIRIIGNNFFLYKAEGPPIFKGMSGGGVYNSDGRVVGVNSAVSEDYVLVGPLVGLDAEWGL